MARPVTAPVNVSASRLYLPALLGLRAVVAALLPLSADEAYYWLWSRHLDAGYLDHPPAVAWLIRGGTLLFGDTPLGVRAAGILLSVITSLLVWDSARTLLKDEGRALVAALLFNLTLMTGVEMLAATPDMPSIATGAMLLFCLARLQQSQDGRWWLGAGVAAGLGLLSKYSALFLIAGAFLWLVAVPRGRRNWLATPWPWAGACLALLVFLPNLLWETRHDWETFIFQFRRVAGGHLTARFLLEFLGAQLGLASPFILVLGVTGLARTRRDSDLFLPAALMLPGILYFCIHALHDRVQGNWPCFLYPAFAVLAASVFAPGPGWKGWCARLAMPVAALILLLSYGQALFGFLPLGKNDPMARLLGVGFKPVADSLAGAARSAHAGAILTTDYESTAWLRYYEPGLKVLQLGEPERYPTSPVPDATLLQQPFLYFVEQRRDRSDLVKEYFSTVTLATQLATATKGGQPLALYDFYLVEMPKGPVPGRLP